MTVTFRDSLGYMTFNDVVNMVSYSEDSWNLMFSGYGSQTVNGQLVEVTDDE